MLKIIRLSTDIKFSVSEATTDFDFLSKSINNHLSDLLKLCAKLRIEIPSIQNVKKGKLDLWLLRYSHSNGVHVFGTPCRNHDSFKFIKIVLDFLEKKKPL